MAYEQFGNEDGMIYVTSGTSYGIQIRLADFVGQTAEIDLPQLYIIHPNGKGGSIKYRYVKENDASELTPDKVREFLNEFKNGSLPRLWKSKPEPSNQ